jgi:hypothetical protein
MHACSNAVPSRASLAEGDLVSVSVSVAPPRLEELLDVLAQFDFPVNPQIYHDAAIVYRYADGHEDVEPTTLVEFPAYQNHLAQIRGVLEACAFPPNAVQATAMLEDMRAGERPQAAPPGSAHRYCIRRRHAAAAA